MNRNGYLAIKYWIKLIYPFLVNIVILGAFTAVVAWLVGGYWFHKVLYMFIILAGTTMFLFVTYRILDSKFPFEELDDIAEKRKMKQKKWWDL